MKVAALVSGGVDSTVSVHMLKEAGYDPHIFYIKIAMEDEPGFIDCPSDEDIEIATYVANKYGCKFDVVDLQKEYWDRVVSYTIDTVKKGLTPNPDVMCNRLIKFGSFEEKFGHEFDKIATGHYATTTENKGQLYLSTAKDKVKDQTYFLGRITNRQLSKVMFPIGHLPKKDVRRIAGEAKLPSETRKDSQGICFLGKINYSEFIRKYLGDRKGPILELETGKKLGEHLGFWFHTIGQRRGLGLSQGPWFVVKKDTRQNIIYVSKGYDPQAQYGDEVPLSDLHFISGNPFDNLKTGVPIKFKIRHTPEFTKGTLYSTENGDHLIKSSVPIAGIAPGQFGVIYDMDENICLGSGIIAD
ncbi:MAG: tRNA 2-thiouridine(34) synthase MnmA [Bacteroidales bacterium]|nr:tRNA 2-thiouridine(34) synthase MnmA [Bacteroidales bacterium]